MTAAMAMPGNTAETFLVHFFGTGLADDRYVVERFRARADGDIVPARRGLRQVPGAHRRRRSLLRVLHRRQGRRAAALRALHALAVDRPRRCR